MAWPISVAAADALRSAHTVKTTVAITDPMGVYTAELISGSVRLDGRSMVRTTANLSLSPAAWERAKTWPLNGSSVAISYGIGALDEADSVEYVPFGPLLIESVSRSIPGGTVEMECSDRMKRAEYRALRYSQSFTAGYTYSQLLITLLSDTVGGKEPTSEIDTSMKLPNGFYLDRSETRLSYVQKAMDALESEIWVNRVGLWEVQKRDRFAPNPVWYIDSGVSGVMLSGEDSRTGERTRNEVIIISEPTDGTPPGVVVRIDLDPTSPTYAFGPFGLRSYTRSAGFVTEAAALVRLGRAILAEQLKLSRSVSATIPPAPHLDPGDLVSITFPGEFPEEREIAALSIDLLGGPTAVEMVDHRVL